MTTAPDLGFLEPHDVSAMFGRGGYEGARRASRELQAWTPALGSPDSDTLPDLVELRTRSRDLERNDPIPGGAIKTVVTDTVGAGFLCRPSIDATYLKLTPAQAQAWQVQRARRWNAFADSTECDITGRQDFGGLTRMVLRSLLSSGDVLAIRRNRPAKGTSTPLRIQLVEADRISNQNLAPDRQGLRGGIETDGDGKAVAFWVRNGHPGDLLFPGMSAETSTWTRIPAVGPSSGELLALLVCGDPERPGQTRGVPLLAPVVRVLKQLSRLSDNELMAAVLTSCFTVFIKRTQTDDLNLPAQGFMKPLDNDVPHFGPAARPQPTMKLGNGSIIQLEDNEDITMADPKRPNSNFDPFFQAIVRQIGIAIEMPYEVLLKHFTASYSASRAAFLTWWRTILTRRAWLVTQWAQPVYEWHLAESVARGEIEAPGFFDDPLARRAWCGAVWVGPSQGQINPKDETDAAIAKIDNYLSSREREINKLEGESFDTIWSQQLEERATLRADGVDPDQPSPGAPAGASAGGVPKDLRKEEPVEV